MVNNKLRVSFTLPGRVLKTQCHLLKNGEKSFTKVPVFAKQVILMSDEAYYAMIGREKPYGYRDNTPWANLSKHQKVMANLKLMAEDLGAINASYELLEE